MSFRCFNHNVKLDDFSFGAMSAGNVQFLTCARCKAEYIFNFRHKSLTRVGTITPKQKEQWTKPTLREKSLSPVQHPGWPQCVVTLCTRFLQETDGDVDGAAELMVNHLIGLGRYKRDEVLESAVQKAMTETAAIRLVAKNKSAP